MQEKNDKNILCHCVNEHISQRHVVMLEISICSQNAVEMRADLGRDFAVSINHESICNISPEQSSIPATSALTFVFFDILRTLSSCQNFGIFYQLNQMCLTVKLSLVSRVFVARDTQYPVASFCVQTLSAQQNCRYLEFTCMFKCTLIRYV